jgi:TatD DNase family protein
MKFNIHTHSKKISKKEIYNHRIGIDSEKQDYTGYYSTGIHPWDLDNINLDNSYKHLIDRLINPNCLALGECGLDKVCGTNLDLQKQVFRKQLKLAHQSNKKVLIIHCVKAYQEIIEEKKKCPYEFIWILHAFNGSKELVEQMNSHDFYFSLGDNLLNSHSKTHQSIKAIPLNRMFFETDESEERIDSIYQEAAEILTVSLGSLESQIRDNINQVFGV